MVLIRMTLVCLWAALCLALLLDEAAADRGTVQKEREADAETAAGGGTRYHSDEEFLAVLDERSGSSDADV